MLLSPPCASFSRATWANFRGPRPVRSYDCPRGLQTLTPAERDRAIMGNIFADFSYEVAALVADGAATFLAMEQPEDLGALASGPHEGLRPASMWQWSQLADLLQKGLRTVAFHLVLALPTLSRHASCCTHRYPCQTVSTKACHAMIQKAATLVHCPLLRVMGAMFQRQAKGAFKTSGSEQWPAKLCQWLSAMLVSTCLHAANAAVGEGDHAGRGNLSAKPPRGPPGAGWAGRDPPASATARGGKPFHNGGGQLHHARSYADGPLQWEWLRERTLESSSRRWVPCNS